MTAETEKANPPVRVSREVYDELVKIQREFYEETRGRLSLSAVIERLLADRKPVQP